MHKMCATQTSAPLHGNSRFFAVEETFFVVILGGQRAIAEEGRLSGRFAVGNYFTPAHFVRFIVQIKGRSYFS